MLPQFGDDDLRNIGSVFESAISSLQMILRLRKEIQGMKESAEKTKQQAELKQLLCEYNEKYPFVFKGNETDLSYFLTKQTLPIEKINQLEPPFRDAVRQNFNEMIQQGLVKVDPEKGELSLTPKGKELLDKPEFLEHVTRSNIELNEQITKGINQELQERNRYVPGKAKEQIEHEEKDLPSKDQAAEKEHVLTETDKSKGADLSENEKDLLFKDQPMEKEKGNAADLNEKEVISAEQIEDGRAPDQTVFTNEQSVVENVQGSKELSKETLSGEINYNDGVISNQNEMIAEGSKKTKTKGGEKPQAAKGNQATAKEVGETVRPSTKSTNPTTKTTAKAGTKAVKEGTKTATDAGTKVTANTATKATSNVATKATGKAAVKATTKAATKAAATGAKAAVSSTGYGAIATAAYEVLSQGVKVTKKITRA